MVKGEVVLVTGAAKGIGRYIAHTFAQEGARLAIADIEPLDPVAGELRGLGAEVLAVSADVTREDQVAAMAYQVVAHFGRIDVLVNNAAIVPHFAWGGPRWPRIRDLDKGFWDRVIDTNLGGTMLCTKHVLPFMEERRSGHVINLHGGGSGAGAAAYVVSKEAIRIFTQFVAEEEREMNVCVVVLSPGGAIACEWAPEEARLRMPGPELAGNRFVLAAQAGMDFSGHLLDLKDGRLEIAD
ncbi:MAG: SDR family NAD(P)-dependent oxidoreductase [Chloroflexi bacterium]|nr:SDR family NAD(P)-dependent oxidoreductase [Chloroflexota bacterium]